MGLIRVSGMAVPLSNFHFGSWLEYKQESSLYRSLQQPDCRNTMEHLTKTIYNINVMYHWTTKWLTIINEHHNALNAMDHGSLGIWDSIGCDVVCFCTAASCHQLLLASVVLDLHENEDDTIRILCLLNYESKTRMVRSFLTIRFSTWKIFPEQRVPHPIPVQANTTYASLDPSWCYRYTRFINHQHQSSAAAAMSCWILLLISLYEVKSATALPKRHSSLFSSSWQQVIPTLDSKIFLENAMINESSTSITTPSGG